MTTTDISDRARVLLKTLVEEHIRDGQPVGSGTLQKASGLPVSAATIRNVMSDLEERGYLHSPHTSAGRVPTAAGYRLFVDTLLQVQPLEDRAVSTLREQLNPDKSASELVQSASNLLSTITAQAGLVTVPRQDESHLRQVEFLPLSGDRVLVILVVSRDVLIVGAVLISWLIGFAVTMRPLMVSKVNTTAQIAYAAGVLAVLGFQFELQMGSLLVLAAYLTGLTTVVSGASYLVDWIRDVSAWETDSEKASAGAGGDTKPTEENRS